MTLISSPQKGDVFPSEGTLAILGDISIFHTFREVATGTSCPGARGAAEQPAVNRTVTPPMHQLSGSNIINAKLEKLLNIHLISN